MRLPTAAVLAILATPVPAAYAAATLPADALVGKATTIALTASFAQPADRVKLLTEVAAAQDRRKNRPAALGALAEAARGAAVAPIVVGPYGRARALARVAASYHRLGAAAEAAAAAADINAAFAPKAPEADRLEAARLLAAVGYQAAADAVLKGLTSAEAKGIGARGARRAGDEKAAAKLAGEALGLWRAASPEQRAATAAPVAVELWRAGYPLQAMEAAAQAPQAAWPDAVHPLAEAIAEEPPQAEDAKKAAAAFMEVLLERCNHADHRIEAREILLLVQCSHAYAALGNELRSELTVIAANSRLDRIRDKAGAVDDADKPDVLAARAVALVRVGEAYFSVGRSNDAQERFSRGERLAAGLANAPENADMARVEAAHVRARAGVAGEAIKGAVTIPRPYERGLALLKIDEAAPDCVGNLDEEAYAALAAAK